MDDDLEKTLAALRSRRINEIYAEDVKEATRKKEDLGLGWDSSWPQERITKILDDYKKFVWLPV